MTDFVLWQHGMRGPHLTILHDRGDAPLLNEAEHRLSIGAAVKLVGPEASLSTADLAAAPSSAAGS